MTGAAEPMTSDSARHRASHHVAAQWRMGAPFDLSIPGIPNLQLSFHPMEHLIVLRAPLTGPVPEVAQRRNLLEVVRLVVDGDDCYELRLQVPGRDVEAAYALVADTVDGIQLEGRSLSTSIAAALQRYDAVLGRASGLSMEQEIGLIGELSVLRHLLLRGHSLDVWVGPTREEHDFAFPNCSIECKTTSSERRTHAISGTGQLTPSRELPLHLVSMQFTRSTMEAALTLPELVETLRSLVGGHRDDLEALLSKAGWRDEDGALYRTAWTQRSSPKTYLVDGEFPRLTEAALVHLPEFGRILDIAYRIDLTGFPTSPPPDALIGLVDPQEHS